MSIPQPARGAAWFTALSGVAADDAAFRGPHGTVASVLVADTELGDRPARVLATRPDPQNRWPRARHGELGLDEGWALAAAVRQVVAADAAAHDCRTVVAVVDSPSQAYGYREEVLAIHQALAAAVDAYSAARLAGHPVVALVVGNGISGAFLAHGLQANRILVLDHGSVTVQVMSRASTARVTAAPSPSWSTSRRECPRPPTTAPRSPPSAPCTQSCPPDPPTHPVRQTPKPPAQPWPRLPPTRSRARPTCPSASAPPVQRSSAAPSIEVRRRLAAAWNS
jgi:malonate decarboxylase beta subunit